MKYILLSENVQRAKSIKKKLNISDEDYEILKNIMKKYPEGYYGLAASALFIEKKTINEVYNILNKLRLYKKHLNLLPKQIDQYDNIEKLNDDLDIVGQKVRYNKDFVQSLKGDFKQKARKDEDMLSIYSVLNEEQKKGIFEIIFPKISRYKNYEEFKKDLIDLINKPIDLEEVLKSIKEDEHTYLEYNKNGIIVASIYDYNSSCKLGSKSWCISYSKNYWDTYVKLSDKACQYFIWNSNVSSYNIESMVGVTINNKGIKTAHLRNDNFVDFKKYTNKYNIPMDIFTELNQKDIDRLIKVEGYSFKVLNFIQNLENGKKWIKDNIEKLPDNIKIFFEDKPSEDKLTNIYRELLNLDLKLNKIDKYNLEEIRYLVNFYKDVEIENINNIASNPIFIAVSNLSLYERLRFINKFFDYNSYANNNFNVSVSGIEVFLYDKIANSEIYDKIDLYKREIHIKLTKEEYFDLCELDEETYWTFETYIQSDDFIKLHNSEEIDYIHRYFNNDTNEALRKKLKQYVKNPSIVEKINRIISDKYLFEKEYSEDFQEFIDFIHMIDNKMVIDPWEDRGDKKHDLIYDFINDIENAAQELVNKDAAEWNNKKLGNFVIDNYNNNTNFFIISYLDLADSFQNIAIKNEDINIHELTIDEWMKMEPGSIFNLDMKFIGDFTYDYPSNYTYLSEADAEEANKTLSDKLNNLAEDFFIYDDEYDREEIMLNRVYIEELIIKNGFKGDMTDNDVPYYIKKEYNNIYIIPYLDIFGESSKYRIINIGKKSNIEDILKEDGIIDIKQILSDDESTINYLDENGISTKYIHVDISAKKEEIYDPNQLEFDFKYEKLITNFKKFQKIHK
jgi:hypothetical protein